MLTEKKYKNVFGITTETGLFTTIAPTEMSATSTDCRWMLARIEQFFDESYPKIAEESAQGQGPYLEALAALVGCNARQTVLLEKAMHQNYQNVFFTKVLYGKNIINKKNKKSLTKLKLPFLLITGIANYVSSYMPNDELIEMHVGAVLPMLTMDEKVYMVLDALRDCASADHWYTYEKDWG